MDDLYNCPACGGDRDSPQAICFYCDYNPSPPPKDDTALDAFLREVDRRYDDMERAAEAARDMARTNAGLNRALTYVMLLIMLAGVAAAGAWLGTADGFTLSIAASDR